MNNEWISVNDRLPEENVSVLVFLNGKRRGIGVGYIGYVGDGCNNNWRQDGWESEVIFGDDVTHWMPLPEEPTE